MKNIKKLNHLMMQKKNGILIDPHDLKSRDSDVVNPNLVFGAMANLETWGYTMDMDIVNDFLKMSEDTFLTNYYNPVVDTLKIMKGDDVSHDNFVFQNFPDSCRKIDTQTLSEMRFARYYTVLFDKYLGTDLTSMIMDGKKPDFKDRPSLETNNLEIIKKMELRDVYTLCNNLLGSKSAISELDRQLIDFAIKSDDLKNSKFIPKEIPYKETLAMMIRYDMEKPLGIDLSFSSYKDFKRTIASLSDQSPSLKKPELKKFTREEKKYLLSKLERYAKDHPRQLREDMQSDYRYAVNLSNYWKTDRYKKYAETAVKVFSDLQRAEKIRTLAGIIGEAIKSKDIQTLIDTLKDRPGMYFRNLNFMLDNAESEELKNEILDIAKKVAIYVPNDILLNAKAQICNEPTGIIRTAFAHGDTRKALQFETKRGRQDESVRKQVDKICTDAVIARLSTKLDFSNEKIYIAKEMKDCPMPFAIKDESAGTRTLTRGTRFEIDGLRKEDSLEKDILGIKEDHFMRLFVYKKIQSGGFVDLSVSFLNENCELVDQCSWTNLKTSDDGRPMAVHSGDGHDCEEGLTEFIDIDLDVLEKQAREQGIRYCAMQIFSYNHIPFEQMDRCFAGVMKIDDMIKGRINENERYKLFDPKLVKTRMDLKGKEISNLPMVYDVKEHKMIVCDIAIPEYGFNHKKGMSDGEKEQRNEKLMEYAKKFNISPKSVVNMPTLESCNDIISNVARNIVNNHYPTLYDLYRMAAVAGGIKPENIVGNIQDATISFDWDGTITPYDRDVISKTFMTVEDEYINRLESEPELMEEIKAAILDGAYMEKIGMIDNAIASDIETKSVGQDLQAR